MSTMGQGMSEDVAFLEGGDEFGVVDEHSVSSGVCFFGTFLF